jgi:hypothetical protein
MFKISHFHGLGSLPFDGDVWYANGCCGVAVNWYFWLWMAKALEGEFKNHPLLASEGCLVASFVI